jgi:hypothetical protein
MAEQEDLFFWLHAAMTRQVARADSPALVVPHPLAPVATSLLSSHRRQLLFLDLPPLSSTSVGQGAQLIAGAVGNLIDQQRQFHEADTTRWAARCRQNAQRALGIFHPDLGSPLPSRLLQGPVPGLARLDPRAQVPTLQRPSPSP